MVRMLVAPVRNFLLSPAQAEVYTSGDSSEDVAQQWLARYAANNQEALTELVNFIFKSAGCSVQVSVDDINDPDNVDGRLADMQEEFQAVSSAHMAM
jgi:cohesin complex subunit SA-1/2